MNQQQMPLKAGRQRGDHKSEAEELAEEKAKGRGPGHKEEKEERMPHLNEPKSRGHQRGFGKNQGKEPMELISDRGTRASDTPGST